MKITQDSHAKCRVICAWIYHSDGRLYIIKYLIIEPVMWCITKSFLTLYSVVRQWWIHCRAGQGEEARCESRCVTQEVSKGASSLVTLCV